MTEEARAQRIAAAVKDHDPKVEETLRIQWREEFRVFPVVSLDIDAVVLNPNSHRIQAQLESHLDRETVRRDPFSEDAQAVIATIIRTQIEGFEDLRTNLAEDQQLHPGVITRVGLLVNANRRAVALRDNSARYIRVAVLPDATADEVSDLELALQMQRDFREDYSFTNRLLFVDDLITKQGRPVDDVARALNVAASSDERAMVKGRAQVEQDTRVLVLIRDIQLRSNGRIPLTDFDEQEIALEELERAYRDTAQEDPNAAHRLRETRILGILASVPYRDLRRFDGDVLEDYVIPVLEDEDLFTDVLPALRPTESADREAGLGGLDILEEDDPDDASAEGDTEDGPISSSEQISALVDLLARSHGDDDVQLPTAEGDRTEARDTVLENMNAALRRAASDIESDHRHENRLLRPYNRAIEAERKLKASADALARVADTRDFDPEPLRGAIDAVQQRLNSLSTDLEAID
jgi:hypothetical protein